MDFDRMFGFIKQALETVVSCVKVIDKRLKEVFSSTTFARDSAFFYTDESGKAVSKIEVHLSAVRSGGKRYVAEISSVGFVWRRE